MADGRPPGPPKKPAAAYPKRAQPRPPRRGRPDDYEPSGISADPRKVAYTAPEVSQGQWRERSLTPRAVIAHPELMQALEHALAAARSPGMSLEAARAALLGAWLPVLRQVIEQAGGDGMDVYVREALKPTGARAAVILVEELRLQAERFAAADSVTQLHAEAAILLQVVRHGLAQGTARKLSFSALERELEGRLEISDFLDIFFQTTPSLQRRSTELEAHVETFRQQLRAMPGQQPGGIYWNFARFKSEKALIDAELKRRSG